MPKLVGHSSKRLQFETEVGLSAAQDRNGLPSSVGNFPATTSPRPLLWESQPSTSSDRMEAILKNERENPSSSSSSSLLSGEPDDYFETKFPRKTEQRKNVSPGSDLTAGKVEGDNGGSPRAFGGVLTAICSLNSLAIKPTPVNAELFYLCKSMAVLPIKLFLILQVY